MNTINSNFVELNETSTFLMGLLGNTAFTEGQLIEAACQEYSISAEDCSKDIKEALQELLSAGLLNVSEK
jgi:hypothetical protein